MEKLKRWLVKQGNQERATPFLEESLLTLDIKPYAKLRISYFLIRTLIFVAINAGDFVLIRSSFPAYMVIYLLVIKNSLLLLSGFWWGGLEVFRSEVRAQNLRHDDLGIAKNIRSWAALGACIAVFSVGMTCLWIAKKLIFDAWVLSVFELSLFALVLRFSLDLFHRTIYAGVYALNRVYRPLHILLGLEMATLTITWLLLHKTHLFLWSYPVMLIITAVLSSVVSFSFTWRALKMLKLPKLPRKIIWTEILPRFRWSTAWGFLRAGLSYASVRLDSILVLALLNRFNSQLELAAFLHLISPLIGAGHDWAQTFYFDFKKLDQSVLWSFKKSFHQLMQKLSVGVGIFLWALSFGIAVLFSHASLIDEFFLLGFFVARSYLAAIEVRAFSEEHYGFLTRISVTISTCMIIVSQFPVPLHFTWLLLATLLILPALVLKFPQVAAHEWQEDRSNFYLINWVARVSRMNRPIRLGVAHFWIRPTTQTVRQVAVELEKVLGLGATAVAGQRSVVWHENPTGGDILSPEFVEQRWPGIVDVLKTTSTHGSGLQALLEADLQKFFPQPLLKKGFKIGRVIDHREVQDHFHQLFNTGLVIQVGERAPQVISEISRAQKKLMIQNAIGFSHGQTELKKNTLFDVTTYCHEGDMKIIFLVPIDVDLALRNQWRDHIRQVNLLAAMLPGHVSI